MEKNSSMKLIIIVTFILTAFAVNCCDNNSNLENSTIVFNSLMPLNDTAHFEFEYKNNFNKKLIIESIQFSCGCMDGNIKNKILSPNQKTEISFSIRNSDYDSVLNKNLTLFFDDNSKQVIPLKFEFSFLLEVIPNSKKIFFKNSKLGNQIESEFKIKNKSNSNLKIYSINIPNPNFKLNDDSTYINFILKPGETYPIQLIYIPHKKGFDDTKIQIKLSDAIDDYVNIYAYKLTE